MTYQRDFTVPAELMEQVQEHGLDVLPELIRIVINAAVKKVSNSWYSCSQDVERRTLRPTPTS